MISKSIKFEKYHRENSSIKSKKEDHYHGIYHKLRGKSLLPRSS